MPWFPPTYMMLRIESLKCNMATVPPTLEILPDLPPDPRLLIPTYIALVLPGETLSVPDIFQHKLPNLLRTVYCSEVSPWSTSPADIIDSTVLDDHIIPPKAVVNHLLSQVMSLTQTIQSVWCTTILPDQMLPGHLPIWILSFWQKAHQA